MNTKVDPTIVLPFGVRHKALIAETQSLHSSLWTFKRAVLEGVQKRA